MIDASAQEHWHEFYDKAWGERHQFMVNLIEQGEVEPLRIIRKLEQFERYNVLRKVSDDFDLAYVPGSDVQARRQSNLSFIKGNQGSLTIAPNIGLPTGLLPNKVSVFGCNHHNTYRYTLYNHTAFLADLLMENPVDAVVELGSGYAQNLIKLFYEGGPLLPYYGGEYTESGVECGNMLAGLRKDWDIQCFQYDFNKPDYSLIKEKQYKRVLVFTCHAIEQVAVLAEQTLASISNIAEEVTCVHFEPFGYQLGMHENEVDKEQQKMFTDNRWNRNLVQELLKAHHQGVIKLEYIGKNVAGSCGGKNPTSIALWRN